MTGRVYAAAVGLVVLAAFQAGRGDVRAAGGLALVALALTIGAIFHERTGHGRRS